MAISVIIIVSDLDVFVGLYSKTPLGECFCADGCTSVWYINQAHQCCQWTLISTSENHSLSLQPTPVILLKEGTDTSQGVPQLVSNINACQVIAEAVRTTLGPRGMDKLMVDNRGEGRAVGPWRSVTWIPNTHKILFRWQSNLTGWS